jgi:cytochrome P450
MLDVPSEHSSTFSKAISAIFQNFEIVRMRGAQFNAANLATEELENYLTPILHERRNKPGDDLISLMVLADIDGDKLTDAEILSNIILLFFAGYETTSNMIGNALIALHQHPEALKEATTNASLIPNVVVECLRYNASVQLSWRIALEDLEIEGTKIECGDQIFAFLGSANHDPEKFQDADKLMIRRNLPKNWHLSFGTGIHNCLGARLATIELEVALGTLFKRLPNIKITNLNHLRWHQQNTVRGVESLTALLSP